MLYSMYIVQFLFQHLVHNPLYLFGYIYSYFKGSFRVNVSFYNNNDLFQELKEGRKSFIRMGDGEIHLMLNGDIGYQKYDPELKKWLLWIVNAYSEDAPFILGLNSVDINKDNAELKKIWRLQVWLPIKVMFHYFFPKNISYADALVFYHQANKSYLKELMQNRRVIVVANEQIISHLHTPDFQVAITIETIVCPDKDAFSSKNDIIESIYKKVLSYNHDDILVLLSCGPASKIIAHELCMDRIQSIDVWVWIELFSIQPDGDLTYRF